MPIKVFVSSTYIDLKDYRQRVISQLRRAGYQVDPMGDWTSEADEPSQFSLDRLDGCQACFSWSGSTVGSSPQGTRAVLPRWSTITPSPVGSPSFHSCLMTG
jgi:hypothetical protein